MSSIRRQHENSNAYFKNQHRMLLLKKSTSSYLLKCLHSNLKTLGNLYAKNLNEKKVHRKIARNFNINSIVDNMIRDLSEIKIKNNLDYFNNMKIATKISIDSVHNQESSIDGRIAKTIDMFEEKIKELKKMKKKCFEDMEKINESRQKFSEVKEKQIKIKNDEKKHFEKENKQKENDVKEVNVVKPYDPYDMFTENVGVNTKLEDVGLDSELSEFYKPISVSAGKTGQSNGIFMSRNITLHSALNSKKEKSSAINRRLTSDNKKIEKQGSNTIAVSPNKPLGPPNQSSVLIENKEMCIDSESEDNDNLNSEFRTGILNSAMPKIKNILLNKDSKNKKNNLDNEYIKIDNNNKLKTLKNIESYLNRFRDFK